MFIQRAISEDVANFLDFCSVYLQKTEGEVAKLHCEPENIAVISLKQVRRHISVSVIFESHRQPSEIQWL